MTESHYQECPSDHPHAGVDFLKQTLQSGRELDLELCNERLERTNRKYRLHIWKQAQEIRNLKHQLSQ